MNTKKFRQSISLLCGLAILIGLTLLIANPTHATSERVECVKSYKVKAGDTLSKIASELDLSLSELADANNLKSPYTIYVGQSLCIPLVGSSTQVTPSSPSATASTPKPNADFMATRDGDKVTVEIQNFPKNASFFVRARPYPLQGGGVWVRIGSLQTDKHGEAIMTYTLQVKDLQRAGQLTICLKNILNNDLVCTTTSSGSNQNPSAADVEQQGSFTASVQRSKLTIHTTKLPLNSTFIVRVNDTKHKLSSHWQVLGVFQTLKDGSITKNFQLPVQYEDFSVLHVCVKNALTDKVICRSIYTGDK